MNIKEEFETIHFLSGLVKEYPEFAGMLAGHKHKLRHEIALEEMRRFQGGHCVKDFGDGSVICGDEPNFNLTAGVVKNFTIELLVILPKKYPKIN